MTEEEINRILCEFYNNHLVHSLTSIDIKIEKVRDEIKQEHEDLLMRAINAETKLKLYEGLFSKLNLNLEVKNEH